LFILFFIFSTVTTVSAIYDDEADLSFDVIDAWDISFIDSVTWNEDNATITVDDSSFTQFLEQQDFTAYTGSIPYGYEYAGAYTDTTSESLGAWVCRAIDYGVNDFYAKEILRFQLDSGTYEDGEVCFLTRTSSTPDYAKTMIYNYSDSSWVIYDNVATSYSWYNYTLEDYMISETNVVKIAVDLYDSSTYEDILIDYAGVVTDIFYGSPLRIDINLVEQRDYTISSMIETTYIEEGNISFLLSSDTVNSTSKLTITNSSYTYLEYFGTFSDFIRFELTSKPIISLFKMKIMDSTFRQLNSSTINEILQVYDQFSIMMSEDFEGKIIIHYLSGNFDYSELHEFDLIAYSEIGDMDIYSFPTHAFVCEYGEQEYILSEYQYQQKFISFQYYRSYYNIYFETNLADGFYLNDYIEFTIGSYEIIFTTEIQIDSVAGDIFTGQLLIYKNSVLLFTSESDAFTYGFLDTGGLAVNTITVWRTLEDKLGVAVNSNSTLFGFDTENIETEFVYWYSDSINRDWTGDIYRYYQVNALTDDSNEEIKCAIILDNIEYNLFAKSGVAQPHFSSTWWSAPFDWIFSLLNPLSSAASDLASSVSDMFRPITDPIGAAIETLGSLLSPILENVIEGLGGIGTILSGTILDAIIGIFSGVQTYLIDWLVDSFDWFVDTGLDTIGQAIADFLYWIVNAIGLLFGVTDLADSVLDLLVNFGSAVSNLINFISLIFTTGLDIFTAIVYVITTYGPIAIMFITIAVMFHVTTTLITMDMDKIGKMGQFYLGIFETLGVWFYNVANMIIQFIGGVIP